LSPVSKRLTSCKNVIRPILEGITQSTFHVDWIITAIRKCLHVPDVRKVELMISWKYEYHQLHLSAIFGRSLVRINKIT
jgi:hypothetical protein